MSTPSSSICFESGGPEPGVVPPISAWWPLEATKKIISLPASSKTGVMTVTSGRWVPPLKGAFNTNTSPGNMLSLFNFMTVLIASDIEPKWTGTWGAFATNAPWLLKRAQEKSNRSLIFTENAVLANVAPICSAIFINRLLKTSSITTSTEVPIPFSIFFSSSLDKIRFWYLSKYPDHPCSTMFVPVASHIIAGPNIFWSAFSSDLR